MLSRTRTTALVTTSLIALGAALTVSGPAPAATAQQTAAARAAALGNALRNGRGATDPDVANLAARSQGVLTSIANQQSIAQRNAIIAAGGDLGGTWHRDGAPPILNDTSDYAPVSGVPTFSGRVADFAVTPDGSALWVGVGLGGVYETGDLGAHWRPLTDGLPNTTTGAVAYSTAQGGTLFDGTGDYDGGFLGLGVWRSTDDGAHWTRAAGVPDGLMTSRIAVDPTNPSTVYAATNRGLFRSTDDGADFVNVDLPTPGTGGTLASCAGDMSHPECALANVVSDVIVRPGDAGDRGGEVLAAVGWERGMHHTSQGWYNSLGNGLYTSPTGAPGSFTNTNASSNGFTAQSHIGRVSLSAATGAGQNHDVVWAMVEDAQKENGNFPVVDPPKGAPEGLCGTAHCYNTLLDNIYESTDFGKTWHAKLPPAETLGVSCPVTSTDQCLLLTTPVPVVGASYAPGVQAFYNNYIRIDPTATAADGTPTRIIFGLEELWEINLDDPANSNPSGIVVPRTIGRYFGGNFCPATENLTVGPVDTGQLPCPTQNDAPTTTHPDQHRGIFVPDGSGGVTYFAGDDGGVFSQHVAASQDFANNGWAKGDNLDLPTTLNYDLAVSGDGTVYTGLQDNGEVRIEPTGRMVEVFGGDAFYSATDPANSKVVYEEYTAGNMSVSTDGGHTWTNINPGLTSPQFATPFAMDPTDANHLITAGNDIQETVSGPNTTVNPTLSGAPSPTASTDWTVVYNLPTAPDGNNDSTTAVDVRGDDAYVGFCEPCYVPSTVANFQSGIATNVGGSAPPQKMTGNGWHVATAAGLPQRYVTSVRMDPASPSTVFVTLADYLPTSVEYRQPGVLGDSTAKLGSGHVFMSTDAGEHFTDISANLPDAPADWVIVRGNQLIVSTNTGVYMSRDLSGGSWSLLGGTQLPVTHMATVQLQPGNPNRLFAATYGMGVWEYDFPAAHQVSASTVTSSSPTTARALPNTSAAEGALRPAGMAATAGLLGGWVALRRRSRRRGRAG
ncbi:MAG TPA: hypothetical protein VFC09_12305 [Candidatus Dormibacteraeota bacterium]|nr:hypothetical protein [Candidatus Dormibacteraeota bacterium]